MARFVRIFVALCLLAASAWASAANYTLWINGRTGAGSWAAAYSGILPGQDDEAVAYHSSGGVAGSGGGWYCNPGDWFCNDPALGTAANEGGSTRWRFYSVSMRDDPEAYNHDAAGNWQGIVGVVRWAMVGSAL